MAAFGRPKSSITRVDATYKNFLLSTFSTIGFKVTAIVSFAVLDVELRWIIFCNNDGIIYLKLLQLKIWRIEFAHHVILEGYYANLSLRSYVYVHVRTGLWTCRFYEIKNIYGTREYRNVRYKFVSNPMCNRLRTF